jgi:hypothetical protein
VRAYKDGWYECAGWWAGGYDHYRPNLDGRATRSGGLLSGGLSEQDGKEGEIGGRDTLEATGLAEGGGTEAGESLSRLGAQGVEAQVVDMGGEALVLHLGSAADFGVLARDVGLVLAVGKSGHPHAAHEGAGPDGALEVVEGELGAADGLGKGHAVDAGAIDLGAQLGKLPGAALEVFAAEGGKYGDE